MMGEAIGFGSWRPERDAGNLARLKGGDALKSRGMKVAQPTTKNRALGKILDENYFPNKYPIVLTFFDQYLAAFMSFVNFDWGFIYRYRYQPIIDKSFRIFRQAFHNGSFIH